MFSKYKFNESRVVRGLSALIHILSVSRVNNQRALKESDYVKTIGLFAGVTLLTASTALLSLGVSLWLYQLVIGALHALNAPQFYFLLSLFVLGSILSQALEFIAKYIGIKLRARLVRQFREYIEKSYLNNPKPMKLDDKMQDNQRAFFESIQVACAHIPIMMKLFIVVFGYGLYAAYRFDPRVLLMSAVVGVVVQGVNRMTAKNLDKASQDEKAALQQAQAERQWIYEHSERDLEINAMDVHRAEMQENIEELCETETRMSVLRALQEVLSKLVQSLSNAIYYLYFSSAVFMGYMTLGELFILLPFVEEIGRSAANLVAFSMMMVPTVSSTRNLVDAWDGWVDPSVKIPYKALFSRPKRLWQYTGLGLLGIGMLNVYLGLSMNIGLGMIFLSLYTHQFPASGLGQLWSGVWKLVEYPFVYEKDQPMPKRESIPLAMEPQCSVGGRCYTLDSKILEKHAFQVSGPNGVGKSLVFRFLCSSKLEINGNWVPGAFSQQESLQLTPNTDLYPEKDYLSALARTFSVDKRGLKEYLDGSIRKISEVSLAEKIKDQLSTGTQQLLYTLSGVYKALQGYRYLCLDEALNAVSSDCLDKVYQTILSDCETSGVKVCIIHHGKDIEIPQVIPEKTEYKTHFVLK